MGRLFCPCGVSAATNAQHRVPIRCWACALLCKGRVGRRRGAVTSPFLSAVLADKLVRAMYAPPTTRPDGSSIRSARRPRRRLHRMAGVTPACMIMQSFARVMMRMGGGMVSPSTAAMPRASAHTSGGTKAYDTGGCTAAAIVGASASVVGTVSVGPALASPTAPVGVVMSCPAAAVVGVVMSCSTVCPLHGSMRQLPSL